MNKINYDREMQKIISSIDNKKKLLLHSCCAPCSSTCIERLKEHFDITIYYYNPNIDSDYEYQKRAEEQRKLCQEFKVKCIVEDKNSDDFFSAVQGLENALEGGERCFKCYELRLDKTAKKGEELGFDYFATTLTLSPLKNAQKLNQIGLSLQDEYRIKYLPSDFKKGGGYLRSIQLSKEFDLYRQSYCGCEFSKNKWLPSWIKNQKGLVF